MTDAASSRPPDPLPDHGEPPPWTSDHHAEPPDPSPGGDHDPGSRWRPPLVPPDEPGPPGWPAHDDDADPDTHPCPHCGRADPSGLQLNLPGLADLLTHKGLRAARPKVALNVYLTDQTLHTGIGVVRTDHRDYGPMLAAQLREFLINHSCQISLRPVLDPDHIPAVDAYEIPQRIRDAVHTRHIASVFPYSAATSPTMDLDHTPPYRHDGTPGQTSVTGLGPLTRREHRARTHGRWTVTIPHPGLHLWRSPHGYYFLVTNHGTQSLGPMPE